MYVLIVATNTIFYCISLPYKYIVLYFNINL